eukprot:TRINITY_DN97803_c0_g1_i2.p1 TRINITY_DN97803_c0_g1~~TRINITY_DN97803_c0_g1_i2.p1  ORF type:complete len:287 (+),score=75.81 TRINITY_DN97803_c0_g1_i2:72-932(+)
MSGLEVLVLDGGATVAGIVGAGAAALGYKQCKEDETELTDSEEELRLLLSRLCEAKTSAEAGHHAVTAAWRGPLSLFGKAAEAAANAGGVPKWACSVARSSRELVDEAAELEDLADVYKAQLELAIREKKSLRHSPICRLESLLDSLSNQLTLQVPALILAHEAFAVKSSTALEAFELANLSERSQHLISQALEVAAIAIEERKARIIRERDSQEYQLHDDREDKHQELPVAILQDRGRIGEVWRAVRDTGNPESLMRALARRTEGAEVTEENDPQELSPWVLAYT